ncbi:MAG TPA: F0F1 ATP synthase subunit B' [Acetobacteraceae bacterium]|nr:F0F1 ATP synthase subunit B' [Acetobacteraceae bacterium]
MRRHPAVIVAATAALLVPASGWAAEAQQSGMPQLDFANRLTTSQVVWMALIFIGLYAVLSRVALPQVEAVLETRARRISSDLDAARAAKADADTAVAEMTGATKRAHAEAQSSIAAAIATAKAEAEARSHVLNERLDAQLAEAEGRIKVARQSAMGALRQVAMDTAAVVITRLTGTAPQPQALETAVGAAMSARGQG